MKCPFGRLLIVEIWNFCYLTLIEYKKLDMYEYMSVKIDWQINNLINFDLQSVYKIAVNIADDNYL